MQLPLVLQLMLIRSIEAVASKPWWELVPEESKLIFSLTIFFINLIVLTLVLYIAGLVVVGKKRALMTDAFLIALVGTVLSTAFFTFIPYGLIALVLAILAWLLLIKNLYETGWLSAIAVGIMAMIVFLAAAILIALIFGILEKAIEHLMSWWL
ncbi:MAG: hypothetical protein QHH24_05400 [Candidatus Bathyarchaeota archaeon]|nr:hypothetical protein [Candidatus Bathyarchaeota archaeon]